MKSKLLAHKQQLVRLAVAVALTAPGFSHGATPPDSAYTTDLQNSHVQDETGQAIGTVNMIMCFMNNMRPDLMVNQELYAAMLDTERCDDKADDNTPNFVRALVNSTRASNDDPMAANIWLEFREGQDDNQMDIFIRSTVSGAPTPDNPYGEFRLDYAAPMPGGSGPQMQGYLQSNAGGVSYVERSNRDSVVKLTQLHLQASSRDAGSGVLRYPIWGTGLSRTVTFGYNNTHFRRSDGSDDRCFSRSLEQAKKSVWRYGLYDTETGERIDRQSGFPFSAQLSTGKAHGYIGYHGLSASPDQLNELISGSTIVREARGNGANQQYTLVRNRGKLIRHSRRTRTLAQTDGIAFQVNADSSWPGLPAELANQTVTMAWNSATESFVIRRRMNCDRSGCHLVDLANPVSISGSALAAVMSKGVFGHSEQLGGEVFVSADAMVDATLPVSYRARHVVHPGEVPAGTTFHCISNCLTGVSLSQLAQGTVNHPYGDTYHMHQAVAENDVITYVMNSDGVLTDSGTPIVFTGSRQSLEGTPFGGGIHTGRLVTSLTTLACTDQAGQHCPERADAQQEFYTWETGPNPWNEYAGARDTAGNLVEFESPLRVTWQVPNDGAEFGEYANRSLVLQYSGFGDLHGLPSYCVNPSTNDTAACGTPGTRWVPVVSIPADATNGRVTLEGSATQYLVKWLQREVRFARAPATACTSIDLGDTADLPGTDSLINPSDPSSAQYIGDKPVVSDAPRIINGVMQD